MDFLAGELDRIEEAGLFREPRTLESAPAARVLIGGREFVNFASNNYLDLATDPRVKQAACAAVETWGAGATASRLLGGSHAPHAALEAALARLKGTEAAAVFPSGYHANVGAIQALLGPEDAAFVDRLAHASLLDGVRLSRATLRVFRHNDPEDLRAALSRSSARRRWVITESVFSMDGDAAPLPELAAAAREAGAFLYVDEAHATGVWGPGGRGLAQGAGAADVCMGTLSKALGGLGGFVCGSRRLVSWIHNSCRSFIYSTALPASCAAAALKALDIAAAEPWRREKAWALADSLRRRLGLPSGGAGPIVCAPFGEAGSALDAARRLQAAGVFAPAIRPPTVPAGSSRIRFSVTAGHREEDVARAADALRPPAHARS